jgi:hypothetical protein
MNRQTGTSDKNSQPKPVPPRNPSHSAKNQRSQKSSADPDPAQRVDPAQVEGEGSYTATHRYNEGVREHIQNHDVEREAEEAREALEGDERPELERAEERGKLPAKR